MTLKTEGARCCSVVEYLILVRWIVGSIPHGGPLSYFSSQSFLSGTTNAVVCAILYVGWCIYKRSLAAKSNQCSGDNRFPLLLSEWSSAI